ncbi:MAG: hypothetical protein HHJ09_14230 [Glaciimonas sp.]|nr:hypothetical protein [Glaciimonas sp.]
MAEKGHWYASFIAVVIGALLAVWAAYALSGAGLFMRLPRLNGNGISHHSEFFAELSGLLQAARPLP